MEVRSPAQTPTEHRTNFHLRRDGAEADKQGPHMEQWLQQLIACGLAQSGVVSYSDLDAAAPPEFLEGPLFDWVVDRLAEAGIALVDDEEPDDRPPRN
jgi:hypothetical protein